ncbi:MAG TPA: TetR/AcrR family transcriptional regulator [Casimicrobiaceae bacterium]|jgi:AcrR family transcriptional regulator
MPRPSRNVDAALLEAGRALYPGTGVARLSVRKVAEHAGVNLGMFHYHFGSKEAFVRALLQQLYDGMFADLTLAAGSDRRPVEALRAAMNVLARFVRDNRMLLRRLLTDALNDEPIALAFVRANLPRHIGVVAALIEAGQRAGALKPVVPRQALAFVAGGVGAPILLGSVLSERDGVPEGLRRSFQRDVVSDRALAERVDLVLAGLSRSAPARTRTR